VLDENENWKRKCIQAHPDQLPDISFYDLIGDFEEEINPFVFLDGGSLPTDLALLKGLARRFENCTYFEIGTWRGESVANVSKVAELCYTLDLPDDEKRAAGMNDEYIAQHAMLSKQLPNVVHLKANSKVFDFVSVNRKFDLIFIDGDHHYEGVLNDTRKVFSSLIHQKSIVVWHDYAYHPEKVRYEVLSAIFDGCNPINYSNLYHVANTMCAVYLPGEYFKPTNYQAEFKVSLCYNKSRPK
jgi:hypothetical protein